VQTVKSVYEAQFEEVFEFEVDAEKLISKTPGEVTVQVKPP
jgi:hypothetical protein